jgi:formate hydrogenlyase transcriptional activator
MATMSIGARAFSPPAWMDEAMPLDAVSASAGMPSLIPDADLPPGIIGRSAALRQVLQQVMTVAPLDATVLLLGETGTGKEVMARAIHGLSRRRQAALVKFNCAAVPVGLLESELFGRERGAYTGADRQQAGRFELAHRGTLFLDEVSDMPMESQAKLLRVLQEREFERLGGTRTIRVDVRLIAATNVDLRRLAETRQFRADLFYRLNVFPIRLPALRERREDVRPLVEYFASGAAQRFGKRILAIPDETLFALERYDWPGNVRELQNFVERSVILSPGTVLRAPLEELREAPISATAALAPLRDAEREHILRALRDTKWIVGGPHGAAVRLGVKRTTLIAKMERLGIQR